MLSSLKYTLKVWQTAVFAAPVIPMITLSLPAESIDSAVMTWLYFSIFGMLFSIPSALILWLSTYLMRLCKMLTVIQIKALLTLISIALTLLPFIWFGFGNVSNWRDAFIPIIYALTIVAGIWFYKLDADKYYLEHNKA